MLSSNQTRQRGFTLIELVVVIVIIGILAAFAIPRFANLARDARIASMNSLAGAVRSTSALSHGIALARNQNGATGTIDFEGTTVSLVFGYPAGVAAGITNALSNLDPAAYTPVPVAGPPAGIRYEVVGATNPTGCSVTYTQPSAAQTPPTITVGATPTADC